MQPKEIIEDKVYKGMYRLKWSDGVLSEDFYNLTRANDILANYDLYVSSMKRSDLMSSLK